MDFFDTSIPPFRCKQVDVELHEKDGILYVNLQIGKHSFYSNLYTRIDQSCLLWGLLLTPMFGTAQFFPISWTLQAGLWSILSLVGTAVMIVWTQYWVKVERVTWVLYGWVALMILGLVLTDLGIFLGWGNILENLCPLWLGLSALGYVGNGLAVRSRAIIAIGLVHFLAIFILPHVISWSFIFTGAVMVLSLLILAQFQWDMRLPASKP